MVAFFVLCGTVSAEPYASTPDVPKELEYRERRIKSLEHVQSTIPDRSEIPIPPYPGSVVTNGIWEAGDYNVIQLVTNDTVDDVQTYYTQALPDFNFAYKLMNPCFFKGPEESFEPMQPGQQLPYVMLTEVRPGGGDAELVPGAQTRVQIYYAP
ncbi:MAG: hypothetical protein ACOC0U_07480 [Desulfovibrionales bacterium]